MSGEQRDRKTFESKVANLIATTRHLEVPHILLLRRMTLKDPESLKWATDRQLNVVFDVLVNTALERVAPDVLRTAQEQGYQSLVMPGSPDDQAEDIRILSALADMRISPTTKSPRPQSEHGNTLAKLLAMSPDTSPKKMAREIAKSKEPPPLFAAQMGPDSAKAMPSQEAVKIAAQQEEKPFTDFPTLFNDTICGFTRSILGELSYKDPIKPGRPPFAVAPEFAVCYEEVLRRFVLPPMHTSRHIQQLGMNHNWAEVGGAKLIDILGAGDHNNPVLHNWDMRWGNLRVPKGKKPKPEENPWPLFKEEATRGNYEPPSEENLQLLQDIIRFEPEVIAKAWRELCQLYEQEFSPSGRQEQAREGAFRDGLMRWAAKLPDHVGEFLAIKAYFTFPGITGTWIRRLLTNFGRTDSERYRVAPFLSQFALSVPE